MTTVPAQMMALRAHHRGGPEELVYERAPTPTPAVGEVLVEVHAAAITFAELSWEETWVTPEGADRTPIIPSHEVAGVVRMLGAGAADVALFDEVYGLIPFDRNGAAAEYVCVATAHVAGRPRSVGYPAAATLPLAALTAWQALVDHAQLVAGERVLVRGGAGGVGLFAVQLASSLGGRVIATADSQDAKLVGSLGAEQVIMSQDLDALSTLQVDVLIDAVGGPAPAGLYRAMQRGGRLVTLSEPPPPAEASRFGVHAMFFVVSPNRQQLAHLAHLVDGGTLRPILAQTFPLANGREAYQTGTLRRPAGKTVLEVRDGD
jgi:NADPH:quinone reductase-like Zn-dependent oxidoreductase